MAPARILIVDDHRSLAEALALRLGREPDVNVVGTASSAAEVMPAVQGLNPDVVLLDVELGTADGIAMAREIRAAKPAVRIIILTFRDDVQTVSAAVRAGVAGFVAKDGSTDELVASVRSALRGERWIQPRLLGPVLDDLARQPGSLTPEQHKLAKLSGREQAVLRFMVRGLDRAGIAEEMYLSANTVRTHTRNLLAKLGVHSSLEAVALALRAGVRPEDAETAR